MLLRLILIKIVFIHSIAGHPSVIIKSGVKSDQNQQQHQIADNHDVAFKLGTSGSNAEAGYVKDNENKHTQAQDVGKYAEENADKKHHLDQSDFANEKFQHEGGGSVADFGNKAAHKKGHHKSGFHNTYHKDESGSNSSYYDDSDDQGGEYVHNSRKGTYGDTNSHNSQGSHLDGNYYAKENAKHGGYDKGGGYERGSADNRNYNRDQHYNNYENQGKVNAGNQYGASGGHVQEKYHHQHPQYYEPPHYYEKPYYYQKPHYERPAYVRDYYEPVPYESYPEKKTITVYEDPRVYEQTVDYQNYEKYPQADYNSGSVELEIRPPLPPNAPVYYNTKPVYDNYYY